MKKVLLSLSMLAAVMVANAQTNYPVGIGAYDDFTTQGNATDDPTGEYSAPVTLGGTAYTQGIFWWKDAVNASDYTVTRANGVYTIVVTKGTAYSPVGLGFGDTNGDGTGIPFSINITNAKTLSFQAKASTGAPTLFIQVTDVNGINGEVYPTGIYDAAKYGTNGLGTNGSTLTSTLTTYTFDLTGMLGQTDANVSMWDCLPANSGSDCPDRTKASAVDFTKIIKVSFFINGGAAYNGTVTLDNVKIGTTTNLGLGTTSAAANIGSSTVYPNPTSGLVSANLTLQTPASVTMIVTDMVGKQIANKNFGTVSSLNGATVFDATTLAKGMYTVTYVLDGTPAKTELVVVK
ncbi:MAG TPA: T9SS type A sorting domain-containing protein [Cytophaga sp.]|jgi:hypothetical protein|nr:T9SS type A sorting domain-containing protein [Cytophaga sp.]